MAEDGGTGYNVVATLPGKRKNGQMVISNAHHDAHFRAGLDDTGAVVATLAAAKAMKMSGYAPNRTVKFVFDTAEEFGYTELLVRLEHRRLALHHPAPSGLGRQDRRHVEHRAHGAPRAPRSTSTRRPSSSRGSTTVCGDNAGLIPNGYEIETPQSTWQNGWSFMASGVPSFEISAGGPDYDLMYHSTYEVQDKVDWDKTASMTKFFIGLNKISDGRQLPYDFVGRGDDLREHFDADELAGGGPRRRHVDTLDKALTRFRKVSSKFGASAAAIAGGDRGPASPTPACSRPPSRS